MKLLLELSAGRYSRGKMSISGTDPKEIYEHINKLMKECYASSCRVFLDNEGQLQEYFTLKRKIQ